MLSEAMCTKLEKQIGMEHSAANLYLQMSAWCRAKGLEGCGTFLRAHSLQEMQHMYRLFDYVNGAGSVARIGALSQPQATFESVVEVFEKTLESEKLVTKAINELVDAALAEKDYSTFNFLQWYVAEQHEEEVLFKGILDKINMPGTDGRGLFHLDREIGRMGARESSGQ